MIDHGAAGGREESSVQDRNQKVPSTDAEPGRLVLTDNLRVARIGEDGPLVLGKRDRANSDDVPRRDQAEPPSASSADLNDPELRAAVAQIVRQELSGGLGQQLSRNIKKMVQREIARVLAEQAKSGSGSS